MGRLVRAAPGPGAWRMIACLQYAAIAAAAIALASMLDPQPHSDWRYYWNAAGGLAGYRRGGLGLLPLALFRASGLGPVAAALCVNLACGAALLWIAYRVDRLAWKPFAQLVAGYLFLIAPFFGIVQLDLFAATLLAVAFGLAVVAPQRRGTVVAAILLAAAAVATKPQLALVLWAFSGMLLLLLRWPLRRRWPRSCDVAVVAMLVASFVGFAGDYAARIASGERASMRTSSAVTLYGGLLVSGTGIGCGYWSPEAARAARDDMRKPLAAAVGERLASRPVGHWFGVVRCKLPEILAPGPYALYWLVESPSVRAQLQARPDRAALERLYARALALERIAYRVLTFSILGAVLLTALGLWRTGRPLRALCPPLWVIAFWGVHAVFEIQGRYFLPMFLLAPLLCAMMLGSARGSTPVPVQVAGA